MKRRCSPSHYDKTIHIYIVLHYRQRWWHKEQELFDYLIMTMMLIIIIISSGGHSISPLHPLLHHLSPIRSPDPKSSTTQGA